ncbi:MAG TPA: patatin-like phospholipase family protein [Ottowia sp.]|uniref:patatin-like phospholipase family protein n=1 Tax=Ottowia sp. TaxID=1898956 RepID=UPI002C7129C7|nr:patatin-like phospholipase family protein [Ottowia sp.]HMN20005.1 patatin-like phospholipase family protein [Ottowia sp.]
MPNVLAPLPPPARRPPVIGVALGSGSARGWAHLGVLRALEQAGVRPGVVCGTSIGALVGGAHVLGARDKLAQWVQGLSRRDVVSFMDFSLGGGLLKGEKLMSFLRDHTNDRDIEALEMPFAAVATALHTGAEVWLRRGSVADAVRASIALPGLFTPVWHDGRLLVDGGLVNPVPVSLVRALGADIVIAVDLNADLLGPHLRRTAPAPEPTTNGGWLQNLQQSLGWRSAAANGEAAQGAAAAPSELPSMLDTLATSIHIMQVRITRSRMSGDPPEFTIAPALSHLGVLDFHRAHEAIDAGAAAARDCVALLRESGLVPAAGEDNGREVPPATP